MAPSKSKGYRHIPAFILLTLAYEAGHGAAILARMQTLLPVRNVDSGAVYRTLAALERDGEISGAWNTDGPGPAKKIYQLTPLGWERLEFWREDISYRIRLLTAFLDSSRSVLDHNAEHVR